MQHGPGPYRRLLRGISLVALAAGLTAPIGCGGSPPKESPATADPDASKRRREMEDFMKKNPKKAEFSTPQTDRGHWA